VHPEAPRTETAPAWHGVQAWAPTRENVLLVQGEHISPELEKVPGLQCRQMSLKGAVPDWQSSDWGVG